MATFSTAPKAGWHWTMMIAQPDAVTPELFQALANQLRRKKTLPALEHVRLETLAEGRAAQILHRGPYAVEGPTIDKLHHFIREHGASFDGRRQKHHEIYLSEPTRTAPAHMKTVL